MDFTSGRSQAIEATQIAAIARKALEDKKGEDLVLLDLRGLSTVTDYVLLATGRNTPHLKALTNEMIRALKDAGLHGFRHSGRHESGWMVVDLLDIVIHVFSPQARAYYALEELWNDAKRVTDF